MSSKSRSYWRHSNSVAAQELPPELRARVHRNRAAFEADQKSMESWARGGFTSFLSSEEVDPLTFSDDVLGLKDEGEEV